ncbi:hypothetical protein ACFVY9_00555 [Streptomyces sp. NPDC059544]|uniref:hypothetical protein n=1 Tax=Streptomyces sp. NPDC059544 TaxID=3346861 RepID=UPI0036ABA650
MSRPIPATEAQALLEAILEALDMPYPATIGDTEVHDRILNDRVMHARIALKGVLRDGDDAGWSADFLRARVAELPATGYKAVAPLPAEGVAP